MPAEQNEQFQLFKCFSNVLVRCGFVVKDAYFQAGMWITADFRLYPPVITANQELVSPTGDHRYRGGTERAHPRGFRV